MSLLKEEQAQSHGEDPSSYAPIAKALQIPDDGFAKLQKKFDIVYFVATEKLALSIKVSGTV